MSEAIVEVSVFTGAVVVPVPGEVVTAESLKVPLQSLANRTKYHQDNLVNGTDGGTHAGDLTWQGEHTFEGAVDFEGEATFNDPVTFTDSIDLESNVEVRVHPPDGAPAGHEVTTRRVGYHNIAVPGDGTTPVVSLPSWPALNSVGYLRCKLVSCHAVGATPNYTITETVFVVRRLAAGIAFQTPTEVLTPPAPSATIELTVSIADDSGDLAISIESSSTSNDCLSTLLVEAIDGPTFALA